jgi:hypothetical protein
VTRLITRIAASVAYAIVGLWLIMAITSTAAVVAVQSVQTIHHYATCAAPC